MQWDNFFYINILIFKISLREAEQQIICQVRKVFQLPVDELFTTFKLQIPALNRSNLDTLSYSPWVKYIPNEDKKLKTYEIGYFHVNITKVTIAAIDQTSKNVYLEIYDHQKK